MSAQGFFRFAATDTASDTFKPKAISYVMAGGLLSAILGPQLNKMVEGTFAVPFLGVYLAVVVLNLVGMFLFLALDLPKGSRGQPKPDNAPAPRSRTQLVSDPNILVAMIVALVAYSLMNLVMTSTPLAVIGCGYALDNANNIVSAHVLAMFAPSFFTGHLIVRFGLNDMVVFGSVTLASLASGGLMNCSGGSPIEGWTAVNLAMAPFLVLAGGAIVWLAFKSRSAAA